MTRVRLNVYLVMVAFAGGGLSGSAGEAKATDSVICQANVGKQVALIDFDTVLASVPEFQRKGEFETTAQFEARTATTAKPPVVMRVIQGIGSGLSYNADKQVLTVYDYAFGGGNSRYHSIRSKLARKPQEFADDIAFDVEQNVASKDSYSSTNGFGAQVQVSKTTYNTKVIWEAQIPWGKKPFVGQKGLIVAQIPMPPQLAHELNDKGLVALQIVPQFKTKGLWFTTPTFQIPYESVHQQDVITGDIQCGYLLRPDKTVAYAFDVK